MWWKAVLLLTLALACGGCTSYQKVLEGLNDRQLTSCVWFAGNGGPYVSIRAVSATGGADLKMCMQH